MGQHSALIWVKQQVRGLTYLICDDEEAAIDKDAPDKDVRENPCHQGIRPVHHQGSIPVDSHKSPGEGARDGGRVDEARVFVVAEIQRRQVEEVDDEDQLSPGEVRADEEHDEGEVQQVVEDEVAANGAGRVHRLDVAREEADEIAALEDEEDDPDEGGSVPAGTGTGSGGETHQ